MNNKMNIGQTDALWNYVATILQTDVDIILLPFILNIFLQETHVIWSIFFTIIALSVLLDFGFGLFFARNIPSVMSVVNKLNLTACQIIISKNNEIGCGLLQGLINIMHRFYSHLVYVLLSKYHSFMRGCRGRIGLLLMTDRFDYQYMEFKYLHQ